MLIRSSLLCDQVFLLDVQRSIGGYSMREYKHMYCSGQSYSASAVYTANLEFQSHVHSCTRYRFAHAWTPRVLHFSAFINPRRACATRVTVVGSVCVCVCLLSQISPLERLFVLKILSLSGQRRSKICGVFSETAPFKSYGVICLPVTSYEVLQRHSAHLFDGRAF